MDAADRLGFAYGRPYDKSACHLRPASVPLYWQAPRRFSDWRYGEPGQVKLQHSYGWSLRAGAA